MEEAKEMKISIPEGYEIDSENSTFECIKFKKIDNIPWRKKKAIINGYCTNLLSNVTRIYNVNFIPSNFNVFADKKQAESALAMAQITQIMKNDERFGGVISNYEWNEPEPKFIIKRIFKSLIICVCVSHYHLLAFHTEVQAMLFLKENKDLVEQYYMI